MEKAMEKCVFWGLDSDIEEAIDFLYMDDKEVDCSPTQKTILDQEQDIEH